MHRIPHERQTVYLSGSWDRHHQKLNLTIAAMLADRGLIVIGDHPSRPSERGMNYAERVDEHLRNSSGIVLVFPHRPEHRQTTSSPMFIELLLAAKYSLPLLILIEDGVVLDSKVSERKTTLSFGANHDHKSTDFEEMKSELASSALGAFNPTSIIHNTTTIILPTPGFIESLIISAAPTPLSRISEQALNIAIDSFLQSLVASADAQYVFQIAPFDRQAERQITADTVFRLTGLKTVNASDAWAGAPFHSERDVTTQIGSALFVLADLTGIRPACVFEVGCAVGAGRPTTILRGDTAGAKLPFGLGKLRCFQYAADEDLQAVVGESCWPYRRRVFNTEIEEQQPSYFGLQRGNRLALGMPPGPTINRHSTSETTLMKEVHFHGPVGTYVDGGQSHQFTTNQTINSGLGIGELMGEIAKHAQELPSADNFQLDQVLKDLQAAAGQPKADKVKLREGLTSAKHIFEHAAGAFIAHGAPTWLPTLVHQIDHFLHSL